MADVEFIELTIKIPRETINGINDINILAKDIADNTKEIIKTVLEQITIPPVKEGE